MRGGALYRDLLTFDAHAQCFTHAVNIYVGARFTFAASLQLVYNYRQRELALLVVHCTNGLVFRLATTAYRHTTLQSWPGVNLVLFPRPCPI